MIVGIAITSIEITATTGLIYKSKRLAIVISQHEANASSSPPSQSFQCYPYSDLKEKETQRCLIYIYSIFSPQISLYGRISHLNYGVANQMGTHIIPCSIRRMPVAIAYIQHKPINLSNRAMSPEIMTSETVLEVELRKEPQPDNDDKNSQFVLVQK